MGKQKFFGASVSPSLSIFLSCALLPWWKLAREKSIKDEFTIRDEFIEEEIAKVCSNRLHCGIWATPLLAKIVVTCLLKSSYPSGWHSDP